MGPSPVCKIGINGFGRIGRNVLRAALSREDVQVMAINHTCSSIRDVVHLIMYDSTQGRLQKLVADGVPSVKTLPNGNILVNGKEIALLSQRNLEKINWTMFNVEYVAECTGKFRTSSEALTHVKSGRAKRVLISAPSPDAPTYVFKVNSENYVTQRDESDVFSCASCTTNCLAPIAKVLDDNFGIVQGFMTTVHASTQSQHVLDGYSKKDRRAGRSVINNIIPTTTGASKAIKVVLPKLDGKISGISVRVPTANVSMVDFDVQTRNSATLDEVIRSFREAAAGELLGVLGVEDEELVSCDFLGHPCSAVIDVKASLALNENFFKIIAWYDNEWSYSCRLLDMLALMHRVDQESSTTPCNLVGLHCKIGASSSAVNQLQSPQEVVV